MQSVVETGRESQRSRSVNGVQDDEISLARADRRLLLGASLRLLVHRFSAGRPVLQNDVIRAASLADDVENAA
jgi:hypothetical protein